MYNTSKKDRRINVGLFFGYHCSLPEIIEGRTIQPAQKIVFTYCLPQFVDHHRRFVLRVRCAVVCE